MKLVPAKNALPVVVAAVTAEAVADGAAAGKRASRLIFIQESKASEFHDFDAFFHARSRVYELQAAWSAQIDGAEDQKRRWGSRISVNSSSQMPM